jgi:hypothetical protein
VTPTRFAAYLGQLASELGKRLVPSGRIVDEVREHLADAREDALRRGLSVDAAEEEALARLGPPETVATFFAADRYSVLDWALASACALTCAATLLLSVSLVALHPPRADGRAWTLAASLLLAQSILTLVVIARGPSGAWTRVWALASGAALLWVGASSVHASLSRPHLEGYAVVLGLLVAFQGAVTLLRLARPRRLPQPGSLRP